MSQQRPERPQNKLVAADADGLRYAMLALERGELVAFPTDTVYALACAATVPAAIERFYGAKRRPAGQPAILLSHNVGTLQHWVKFRPRALELAARHWPGPLTLVLPVNRGAVARLATGARDALARIASEGTMAVRIPAHETAQQVLWSWGQPLCTSSANRAGGAPPRTGREVVEALGDAVAVVLDGDCPIGQASSILDLARRPPRVIREGAIAAEELLPER
ncbi:MAG: L-threonylcarbamoyladenylate synthase [Candidatus Dormibacteria bacterium]